MMSPKLFRYVAQRPGLSRSARLLRILPLWVLWNYLRYFFICVNISLRLGFPTIRLCVTSPCGVRTGCCSSKSSCRLWTKVPDVILDGFLVLCTMVRDTTLLNCQLLTPLLWGWVAYFPPIITRTNAIGVGQRSHTPIACTSEDAKMCWRAQTYNPGVRHSCTRTDGGQLEKNSFVTGWNR